MGRGPAGEPGWSSRVLGAFAANTSRVPVAKAHGRLDIIRRSASSAAGQRKQAESAISHSSIRGRQKADGGEAVDPTLPKKTPSQDEYTGRGGSGSP